MLQRAFLRQLQEVATLERQQCLGRVHLVTNELLRLSSCNRAGQLHGNDSNDAHP